MNEPDFRQRFSKEALEQLLTQAAAHPPEVTERLRWFLAFCTSGSIGATCRSFGIARTTFYRWAHRFNPYDLRSLADAPNLLTQERLYREPSAPVAAPAVTRARYQPALIISLLLNALFAGSVLLSALWQNGWRLSATTADHGAAEQVQDSTCSTNRLTP